MRQGNTYLSKIKLAHIALTTIDNDQLLAMDPFNTALFELLYVGALSGVEVYMQDRLRTEVMSSETNMKKYIKAYNWMNRRKERKIDASNGITKEVKEKVEDSLDHHQIYHNIGCMFDYLNRISDFDKTKCSCICEMNEIIKNRNAIIHNNSIRDKNKLIISPRQVGEACMICEKFIEEIELEFQSKHCVSLIDLHPDK